MIYREFGADRPVGSGGVDIQNAASDGKLTGTLYHGAAAVAGTDKLSHQIICVVALSYLQTKRGCFQYGRRHSIQAERFPRHDLKPGCAICQIKELAQTLLFPASGGYSGIVQCQFSARQDRSSDAGKSLQLLLKTFGSKVILADQNNRTGEILMQRSN